MAELGIVDIREIVRIINKVYHYDFSNFALTSFKFRLEKIIDKYGLVNASNLFRKLSEEEDFFDNFLNEIFVPSTEMFRDPSLWRWLREEYFPNLPSRHFDNFKIWIPLNVSGAELYSLCILLKEMNLLDKVKIIATVLSNTSLEIIKSGKYSVKSMDISSENYKRFQGLNTIEDYCQIKPSEAIRNTSLINSVEFIKDDITFSKAPQNVKLIFFRNVMIYFNPSLQNSILEKIYNSLSAAGNLIIGAKEEIRSTLSSVNNNFELINENENVYKRRI